MIFTTKPLKVVRQVSKSPIEDFRKHQLNEAETKNLTRTGIFTRMIGIEGSTADFIEAMGKLDDYFLGQNATMPYLRLEDLKFVLTPMQTESYVRIYEEWLKLKAAKPEEQFQLSFPTKLTSDTLEWTQKCAFKEVLDLYERYIPNVNPSTTKNFAVKLLSWIGYYLPLLITGQEKQMGKLVYVGPIKRQEFLFLYFLFLMGCDVLCINPKEDDLVAYEEVKLISEVYYCSTKIQEPIKLVSFDTYKKQLEAKKGSIHLEGSHKESVGSKAPSKEEPRKVPVRPSRPANDTRRVEPPRQGGVACIARNQVPARGNITSNHTIERGALREHSYEELAQLSTSIVMITVLDGERKAFKGGSGVVIHEEGYILTNFHVVRDGCHFEVQFENEQPALMTSRIVKYHPNYDLALIKVERRCKPLPLYTEDRLVRGQRVVAIGSPLGLFNTVSDGIISAFREIEDLSMIQFTAPISHGSSGGALLDMYGRLIGIITAGFDAGQNLNLAVRSEQIYHFANNFL